jgi:ABC-type multidrug transport system ATPase subunit
MSEEILRALMQLFAILTKQDGGVEEDELKYVRNFLRLQLGESENEVYFDLFREISEPGTPDTDEAGKKQLTSVLDSVRILGICKKINKTLNQSQKIVVLVRLFELMAAGKKTTPQRLAIVNTVAEVFKISKEDYEAIRVFALGDSTVGIENSCILYYDSLNGSFQYAPPAPARESGTNLVFLRIQAVDLYFVKYTGHEDLFLNGLGLHRNRIHLFSKGSTIKLPRGKPVYYSDVTGHFLKDLTPQKIWFEARNIGYTFPGGVKGIRNISLSASHGNLIGILGASGAGKTTLLNILSGIEKPDGGSIRINGQDIFSDKHGPVGAIGYVPQDDLLIEELTVFENLYFNARFCFGNLDKDEIVRKVEETLAAMGLTDKKDLKVGSVLNKTISGGQRKRLNIALELIREPSILFLDEPTSGLSSRDSENVMDLLRELTLKGKLVFSVIHQPSSELFKMFDKVIILDQGGYMAYMGNPVEAVMYFKRLDAQINSDLGECPACGNVNPELVFNILEAQVVDEYGNYTPARKVSPQQWEAHFNKEREPEKAVVTDQPPPRNLNIPRWIKQLRIYSLRDLKSKLGNTQYILLTMLEAPLLGLILSFIIRYIADPASNVYVFRENENIPVYIFMTLIVAAFLGLTVSAEEIFRDRKILRREKFLQLSRSGYLMSKILILFIISALQALTFVLVANAVLEIKNMSFYYWFAFFTTAACANLIGLNISSAFNSAVTIYIVIPLFIIPMMVLSGAMFSFEKLNRKISRIDKVPMLAELMPTKWSYEALMVHQFRNNYFQVNFYDLDKEIINADFKQSYFIPELESRLRRLREEFQLTGSIEGRSNDYYVIRNEILNENRLVPEIPLPDSALLNPELFNATSFRKIENYLSELSHHYLGIFTAQNKMKNNKVRMSIRNLKDTYYSYLNQFHNEAVSDHVRKIYERKKIVEYNQRLVRMIDPVYLDPTPEHALSFRTHFFAPRKHLFGKLFDTFWFNMAFIWVLSLALYVLLYYNVLGKIVGLKVLMIMKKLLPWKKTSVNKDYKQTETGLQPG